MREHEVLCVGGLCDGRRAAPLYGSTIRFAAEAQDWMQFSTDPQRSVPAFEYQIHELRPEGGKVLRIGVPVGSDPGMALEAIMDRYPEARR